MNNTIKTIALSFFSAIIGGYCFYLVNQSSGKRSNSNEQNLVIPENRDTNTKMVNNKSLVELNGDFVKASNVATRSVVYIKTVSDAKYNSYDVFDFFFGNGGRGRKRLASGSGVIFTDNGYIVTNNHVIESAETIEVIHEKRSYKAKVIGTDPSSDIAVLKINAKGLPSITRGTSKKLNVGEWVLAIGNPFNLTSTVTAGIVSAKGRDIALLGGQFPLESFIQTDAAINPGNSGGALVNIKGQLVGINTAILSHTGSYAGYGFAVPVDIVAKVFNDLVQYGEVQKAFSGIKVSELSTKLAQRFNIKSNSFDGAVVTEVNPDSEADKAGIKPGDVILKINSVKINGKSTFMEEMSYFRPGDKIKLTYRRGKSTQTVQLKLKNREGTTGVLKREIFYSKKLGVELEKISKTERQKLRVESGGVRVLKVRRGLFSRLRMQEGFVITHINRQPVKTPKEVESLLSDLQGKIYIQGVSKDGTKGYYSFYF
ncbi:trypsin-like peptidase domain-containing protein [Microscilla marina]|uniref:DO serine protease n=1 Tax=Microscilla marina ATCC 23134 TaxID=313606 RepID=A1ZZB5_MICM2|nr:trypsin-like peptidase domain-containing protein [Microscilla marina]EAY24267.1 DO serine protease [Microscilla marina ATCC 23134]